MLIFRRLNKKCISVVLCCDKASSPSSNELSIAMGSTPKVQPIAMKFAERKHLMPSNNKFARPQNPHLRLSKLRFFGLRKPKTTSFYSTSQTKGDD